MKGRETLSRALPRGRVPLDSHLFGGGGGDGRLRPSPCLAGTSRRHDRPPTHFFVKKKFSSACGGICTTHPFVCQRSRAHARQGVQTWDSVQGSFFLYEKSVLRESDSLRGRKPEVCTDSTTPFSALKKALQIMGIQGESLPLGESARAELSRPSRSSVYTRSKRSRSLPSAFFSIRLT